jgi:UPF0755 protein
LTVRVLLRIVILLVALALVGGMIYVAWQFAFSGPQPQVKPFATIESTDPQDIALGLILQSRAAELNAPASNDPTPIAFSIPAGELPSETALRLKNQGLVSDADLFVTLVKYRHAGNKIQAGDYLLRKNMTMDEILSAIQQGHARLVGVTIRPGMRAEEIAERLKTVGLINYNADEFVRLVKNGKYDYDFLRDRPTNAPTSIEGYLFPETYQVPFDIATDALINVFLQEFKKNLTDKMRQEATTAKMTLHEVVTLAAIIEREAQVADERPIIASVYLNRIKKKMRLQADPTVQYAMGYQAETNQWWKSPVTLEEYSSVDSPYNTYLYAGLPPGPIDSPSLASIVAVLEPAKTDYLFFLGKGDGTHVFAKTYEEQQANCQKLGYQGCQ